VPKNGRAMQILELQVNGDDVEVGATPHNLFND